MVTVDEFSRLVSGIYAAATTPQHWESALDEIRRSVGGTVGALSEAVGGVWSIRATTAPPDVGKTYADYYYRLDHVLATVEHGPAGAVRTGTELIAPRTNTEFYNDWLRPNDFRDGLFVRLNVGQHPSCLIVTSQRQTEAFDTPERVKLMGALVPHLQHALRTQSKLAALANRRVDLAGAVNAVRHGVILIGPQCWVVDLNTSAEEILRASDGVCVRSGRLTATHSQSERTLHRALHDALVGTYEVRRGRSFTCERASGKRPYVIHVLPIQRSEIDGVEADATALVLIVDPERELEPPPALLRRLFGLTRAEAEVAVHIARGAELAQISEELAVSLATVRTHLHRVFEKTDTHRQAELIRRLLTLTP